MCDCIHASIVVDVYIHTHFSQPFAHAAPGTSSTSSATMVKLDGGRWAPVSTNELSEEQRSWMMKMGWIGGSQQPAAAPHPSPGAHAHGPGLLQLPGHPPGPPPANAVRVPRDYHVAWCFGPAGVGAHGSGPAEPKAAPAYEPPAHRFTTLGWLKYLDDNAFPYFE